MSRTYKDMKLRYRKDIPVYESHQCGKPDTGGYYHHPYQPREWVLTGSSVVGREYTTRYYAYMIDANGKKFIARVVDYFPNNTLNKKWPTSGNYRIHRRCHYTFEYDEELHPGAVPVVRDDYITEEVSWVYSRNYSNNTYPVLVTGRAKTFSRREWVDIIEDHYRLVPKDFPPCDIDEKGKTRCTREGYQQGGRWYNPRKWERRECYYVRDRVQTREDCREALKDWNTNGDTDVDVLTNQHRHSPYKGGYWD